MTGAEEPGVLRAKEKTTTHKLVRRPKSAVKLQSDWLNSANANELSRSANIVSHPLKKLNSWLPRHVAVRQN